LDDVTVSVTQDGDAGGWRIHAEWFPEQRGPID
jgi:hypothetical protein